MSHSYAPQTSDFYLAAVIDLFGRQVMSWSMQAGLIKNALRDWQMRSSMSRKSNRSD